MSRKGDESPTDRPSLLRPSLDLERALEAGRYALISKRETVDLPTLVDTHTQMSQIHPDELIPALRQELPHSPLKGRKHFHAFHFREVIAPKEMHAILDIMSCRLNREENSIENSTTTQQGPTMLHRARPLLRRVNWQIKASTPLPCQYSHRVYITCGDNNRCSIRSSNLSSKCHYKT
jgi:hypothetical protein